MHALLPILLAGWVLALLLGGTAAGIIPSVPPAWHPAMWLAEGALLRVRIGRLILSLIFLAGVLLACGSPRFGTAATAILLFTLIPLPWCVIDIIRRDMSLRSKELVFFDCYSPVGTRFIRHLNEGKMEEENPIIYLYMDDDDWRGIEVAARADREYLNSFLVKGTLHLYRAQGDNEFMQFFDSLQLYKFVVHPGNPKAMAAIEKAMRQARVNIAAGAATLPGPTPTPPPAPAPALVTEPAAPPPEDPIPPPIPPMEFTEEASAEPFLPQSEEPPVPESDDPFANRPNTPQLADPQTDMGRGGPAYRKTTRRSRPAPPSGPSSVTKIPPPGQD